MGNFLLDKESLSIPHETESQSLTGLLLETKQQSEARGHKAGGSQQKEGKGASTLSDSFWF